MTSMAEMIWQLFKGNIKKYMLFLCCNVLAIAMLSSLVSLSRNTSFMSMDSIISSNVYAPMYILCFLICFFIPYTQNLLQKEILQNYGILQALGMELYDIVVCFIAENILICLAAILLGIGIGQVLEILLIVIVNSIVKTQITITLSLEACISVVLLAVILYGFTIALGCIGVIKKNVYSKLLSRRKAEEKKSNITLFIIGLALFVIGFILLFALYKNNRDSLVISCLCVILGQYICIDNGQFIFEKFRTKKLFWVSDFIYYYKRNKGIVFWLGILYFVITFMLMVTFVTFPNFKSNAEAYHPFDISFSVSSGMQWKPDSDYLNAKAEDEDTKINKLIKTEYINIGSYSVFDVSKVNQLLGRNYDCQPGQFIFVYCYVEDDGYEHEIKGMTDGVCLEGCNLEQKDVVCDVLFGNGCGCHDNILLVNSKDYETLGKKLEKEELFAINLTDEGSSIKIEEEISADIANKNGWVNDLPYISCRALAKQNANQSSKVLLLLMLYDCVIVIFTIYIIVRYKLGMELDGDTKRIHLLQSLGGEECFVKDIYQKKVLGIIMIPFATVLINAIILGFGVNYTYGYGVYGMEFGIFASLILMIIMYFVGRFLSERTYSKSLT